MDDCYLIDDKTVKKTDKCWCSHACLKSDKEVQCPVSCVVSNVMFVKKNTNQCRYFTPFGNGGSCRCPVRNELYKKYKV